MNKKAMSIILGMALVTASGGALWGNGNEVKALDSEKAVTSATKVLAFETSNKETTKVTNKENSDTTEENATTNEGGKDKEQAGGENAIEKANINQDSNSQKSGVTNQQGTSFSDVKDTHWAKKSITAAIEKGYVSGYPGGVFKPEQAIKRDELLANSLLKPKWQTGRSSGSQKAVI